MIAFAELSYGQSLTVTTPTRSIISVSYGDMNPSVIIQENNILYSSVLFDSGYIIQDEPVLTYRV